MESSIKNLFFTLLLLVIYRASFAHGSSGFSVHLINRDHSPLSPSYNPSQTYSDRVKNSIARSTHRLNSFITPSLSTNNTTVQAPVSSSSGSYFMKYSIGSPPIEILGIVDTGSDLTWTQCKPCEDCYKQSAPIFDSEQSSSYEKLSCADKPCVDLPSTSCSANICQYSYSYGDGSHTIGNVAAETFTFDTTSGGTVQIPDLSFGCGHNNGGVFDGSGSGIVGFGAGALSLPSQLGSGKFSYCLIPYTETSIFSPKTSTLNFGSAAEISGDGVLSTPMVKKPESIFYYLTLEGITVGPANNGSRLDFKTSNAGGVEEGNIIIDSGTTMTYLHEDFYQEVEDKVKSFVNGEIVESPEGSSLLCYKKSDDLKLPHITVHFSGADLELEPVNVFVQLDVGFCFTFVGSDRFTLYGNLAQTNFLVEYDLKNEVVKFKKTECSKH